jgi:hypothetical protein
MKHRKKAAELIGRGKNTALYCHGLFADTNILYLDKFYGATPAVVIDNDPKKKGFAELGVPVMPHAEAAEKFEDLHYYIQGNTYIYSVTGDLLSKGVKPENIINYVPVEKRDGCLIAETSIGISGSHCNVCYECGFNYNKNHCRMAYDGSADFDEQFALFRGNAFINEDSGYDCRSDCPMHKSGYYAARPKIRLIGNYNSDYCELACMYCFLRELGMSKQKCEMRFRDWLEILLKSKVASEPLVLHMCPTEKTKDGDVEESLGICRENADAFEAVHLFSCCYAYRENLEPLLAKGMAKAFWSFDAGTEETFEKIKQRKNIFNRVLDNVAKYRKADAFGGFSIIPKYSIFKGVNDNEKDFDGFIEICKSFNVKYCGIQWDYADNDNTDGRDFEIARLLCSKITDAGLKTTYTSGSTFLSKALNSLAFYENL